MERCRGTVAGGFAPGQDEAALVTRNEIAQLLSVGKRANKDEERAGRNGLPSLTAVASDDKFPEACLALRLLDFRSGAHSNVGGLPRRVRAAYDIDILVADRFAPGHRRAVVDPGAAQPLDPLGPQLPRYLCAIGSGSPSGSPAFTYPSV